jgi:hypothetical protein
MWLQSYACRAQDLVPNWPHSRPISRKALYFCLQFGAARSSFPDGTAHLHAMRPFVRLRGTLPGRYGRDLLTVGPSFVSFFSAVRLRLVLLLPIMQPGNNVPRGDQLAGQMRVDGACMHDQSLVELRLGEILGFRFILECLRHPRASPFRQYAPFGNFERHEPDMRHLSPADDAPQQNFRHSAWAPAG